MANKKTITIVKPEGSTKIQEDFVLMETMKGELVEHFNVRISPVKSYDIADGMDPWQEIYCPVCCKNEFVTINLSLVACNNCYTELCIRPTSGDRGFMVKASTKNTDPSKAAPKKEKLVGCELFMVVLSDDIDREWLVSIPGLNPVSIDHFLLNPSLKPWNQI